MVVSLIDTSSSFPFTTMAFLNCSSQSIESIGVFNRPSLGGEDGFNVTIPDIRVADSTPDEKTEEAEVALWIQLTGWRHNPGG